MRKSPAPTSPPPSPDEPGGRAGRDLWVMLGLAASVLFVYAQTWRFDLVDYDDLSYIVMCPQIAEGLNWAGFKWAFASFYSTNWIPLTWISFMAEISAFGRNAGWLHIDNMMLHLASVLLLFRMLRRSTGEVAAAGLAAALFAVHPVHVESVAWIAERKDALSTFFLMLSLSAYLEYAREPRLRRYLTTFGLLALGLMAKPMLVTAPCLMLLLDHWPLGRLEKVGARRLLLEKLPFFALVAGSSLVTVLAQRKNMANLQLLPFSLRFANAVNSYWAYIGKLLWPVKLTAFYPYPEHQSGWLMLAGLFGLVAVTLLSLREAKRRPYFVTGWLWYVGSLIPVIGLVQVGDQALADRYTYIPSIGLCFAAAWALREAAAARPALRQALWSGAVAAVAALAVVARVQTGYWRDTRALWTHALAVSEHNYIAESGIGTMYLSDGNLAEAIAHYRKAVQYEPKYALIFNTLGATLLRYGHAGEALPYLERAVELRPQYIEARSNLGMGYAELGRLQDAVAQYRRVLELEPGYAEVENNLGIALAREGKAAEAVTHFERATAISPDYADAHYDLAVMLVQLGRRDEAKREALEALRLKPGNQDIVRLLRDLSSGG